MHLEKPTIAQRAETAKQHLEMSLKWKGEVLGVVEMRRHYSNYFKGIPHFKEYRTRLVSEMDKSILFSTLDEIKETFSFEKV